MNIFTVPRGPKDWKKSRFRSRIETFKRPIADCNFQSRLNISLTIFYADFGKELPFQTSWRGPSWNPPSPRSVLCPFLYRTEHFSRRRKGRKGAEKRRGRGVANKKGKKEKRTRENRSVQARHTARPLFVGSYQGQDWNFQSRLNISEAWGPPQFQEKRSRSERAILGALGEFRGILGAALGIGNPILGIRNSILGMASHDLSNTKTTILGVTPGALPGSGGNPNERFSFAPPFSELFFENWGGPRAQDISISIEHFKPGLKISSVCWAHSEGHPHTEGAFTGILVNERDLRQNSGECPGGSRECGLRVRQSSPNFASFRQSSYEGARMLLVYPGSEKCKVLVFL